MELPNGAWSSPTKVCLGVAVCLEQGAPNGRAERKKYATVLNWRMNKKGSTELYARLH